MKILPIFLVNKCLGFRFLGIQVKMPIIFTPPMLNIAHIMFTAMGSFHLIGCGVSILGGGDYFSRLPFQQGTAWRTCEIYIYIRFSVKP